MLTNTQLYYRLYSYREGPPHSRFVIIRHEILTPLSTTKGVAEILDLQLQKNSSAPSSVRLIQQGLIQAAKTLQVLTDNFAGLTEATEVRALSPSEQISAFRDRVLPQATTLRITAQSMQEHEAELKQVLPKADFWIERIPRAAEHIWVTIDCLTNPQLQLPPFLIDWLTIRDTVQTQAAQGDSQALEPLLQALQNPLSDIRCEAASLLGHLKDERSVSPLIQLLKDTEKEVQIYAAYTLKLIGGPKAEQALKQYYESGDM